MTNIEMALRKKGLDKKDWQTLLEVEIEKEYEKARDLLRSIVSSDILGEFRIWPCFYKRHNDSNHYILLTHKKYKPIFFDYNTKRFYVEKENYYIDDFYYAQLDGYFYKNSCDILDVIEIKQQPEKLCSDISLSLIEIWLIVSVIMLILGIVFLPLFL